MKKIRYCIIILGIIGLAMVAYSMTLPLYNDYNEYLQLNNRYYDNSITESKYYVQISELKTSKNKLFDFGSGIVTFSSTILFMIHLLNIKNNEDVKNLMSLSTKQIWILSNIGLLLQIPGCIVYYVFRSYRGDYPPFADNITIPIERECHFIVYLLIILNLVLFIVLRKTTSPRKLFPTSKNTNLTKILNTLSFLMILINLLTMLMAVYDGDWFLIVGCIIFIYAVLSIRSLLLCLQQ